MGVRNREIIGSLRRMKCSDPARRVIPVPLKTSRPTMKPMIVNQLISIGLG